MRDGGEIIKFTVEVSAAPHDRPGCFMQSISEYYCLYVCEAYVYLYGCVFTTCGGQRLTLNVFFHSFLLNFLGPRLSLNPLTSKLRGSSDLWPPTPVMGYVCALPYLAFYEGVWWGSELRCLPLLLFPYVFEVSYWTWSLVRLAGINFERDTNIQIKARCVYIVLKQENWTLVLHTGGPVEHSACMG